MNLRTKLVLSVALAGAAMTTNASAQGGRWCDCITIAGGNYQITPGYWTRNNVVIGRTWIGGGNLNGAGTSCSYVNLPVPPNDFHFGGDPADPTNPNAPNPNPDIYTAPNGQQTGISAWSFWGGGIEVLILDIYANVGALPGQTDLDYSFDFLVNPDDPFLTLVLNGSLVYQGPNSVFDPPCFGLERVGTRTLDLTSVWTQNIDNTTIQPGSVACQNAAGITDNSWWRKYDPIECGLTTDYIVKSCTFGVELATEPATGAQKINVNIRRANAAWPAGGSTDPILCTTSVMVPDSGGVFITAAFNPPCVIPAGTCIAVEVMALNGMATGAFFFIGSNGLGETAPCYISALDCGVPDPTPLAVLGFPDVHCIIDLACNPAGPPPIDYICDPANPNSTGQSADLTYSGNRDQSQGPYTGILTTVGLPPGQFGYYLASRDPRVPGLPVSNGRLCLQGDIARLIGAGQPGVKNSGPAGIFVSTIDTGNIPTNPNRAILRGETWYFQAWYRDQGPAGSRSNFSNACCVPFF